MVCLKQACTTYGPRAKCGLQSFQTGPQSPNLHRFWLDFWCKYYIKMEKTDQSGPQMCQQHFFGPPLNLCCASLAWRVSIKCRSLFWIVKDWKCVTLGRIVLKPFLKPQNRKIIICFNIFNIILVSESCGLAVEHSAHDQKVVGSLPVQC